MNRFRVKYTWKDNGWVNIVSAVSRLGSTRVQVGVLGAEASQLHEDSKLTIGEVAILNEFGNGHIPERSFLRSTMRSAQGALTSALAAATRRVIFYGVSADSALRDVGRYGADAVKLTIAGFVPPPNAPATVMAKGHDHTLIDSGSLLHAITYQIVAAAEGAIASALASEEFSGDVE
jgi:hypothetical protein